MILYTFQPKELVDLVYQRGCIFVNFTKTNCYKQGSHFYHAYVWMGRKLAEKTNLWLTDVYDFPEIPRDDEGKGIDENGERLPLLPFWGWYMIEGECRKPDNDYMLNLGQADWNLNNKDMILVTLDVPEKYVLLSDVNAWYCALEGRPCYEYEENEEELSTCYESKMKELLEMDDDDQGKRQAAEDLYIETISSWDNILRTEGRKPKKIFGLEETRDIQAVFPFILKEWVVDTEAVKTDTSFPWPGLAEIKRNED